MKILVDGDSCPVKNIIMEVGKANNIHVIIVANINHIIDEKNSAELIYVDSRSQEADIVIVNKSEKNDIIITNDYGLASLVIQKNCYCISPSGNIFNKENIDRYLFQRHMTMKLKRGGHKIKGPKKRQKYDDERFRKRLVEFISRAKQIEGKT